MHRHGPLPQTLSKTYIKLIFSRILKVLDAKGGGKGRRLNAKFTSLKYRKDAENILENYFQQQQEA